MAQDATLPDAELASQQDDDGSIMPSESRQRGRRRKQRTSLIAMIHAELSIMLFMLGLGLWVSLIILSAFFPFGVVDDMGRGGIAVTALAALAIVLLAPSVLRCWTDGDRLGSVLSVGLILVMIGNWLGWMYHFNLVVQLKELLV